MKANTNFFRTQNGGIHSVSKNAKVDNVGGQSPRSRSAHHDRMYILHAGVISASKRK